MNRNSVRIIGGAWRGRKIGFPDLPGLRPTPDRVRETLFNWLQHDIRGAACLDLFAGSGALGFEALSRGAARVVWVEKSVTVARHIEEQLARLAPDALNRNEIVAEDAERWLAGASLAGTPPVAVGAPGASKSPFDLIFLDPPYGQNLLPRVLPMIAAAGLARPGGFIYLECERNLGAPSLPPGWALAKSKSAGEVGYHLARVTDRPTS